jgi:hypothetical protein
LHAKAKAEPGYRFYALYDKISREDILAHAYAQCRSNKGAPGVQISRIRLGQDLTPSSTARRAQAGPGVRARRGARVDLPGISACVPGTPAPEDPLILAAGASQPAFADAGWTDPGEIVVGVDPFALRELLEQGAIRTEGSAVVDVFDA